jgi:hypothetical protein
MKTLSTLVILTVGILSLRAATNPAPEMTISFPLNKDTRTWTVAYAVTNENIVFTKEWVPKGDSIERWKEMFDEKSMLVKDTIREHIDGWKRMLAQVDPKAEVKEEKNADGTITVTYTSIRADEMGISRYFKASDGIYILSYRVRPKLKDDGTLKTWREILSSATLVSTHEKKKG